MKDFRKIIEREKKIDRWSSGIPHNQKSLELMEFLCAVDYNAYDDYFKWRMGGDGDNGETLMYQMDAYFEAQPPGSEG